MNASAPSLLDGLTVYLRHPLNQMIDTAGTVIHLAQNRSENLTGNLCRRHGKIALVSARIDGEDPGSRMAANPDLITTMEGSASRIPTTVGSIPFSLSSTCLPARHRDHAAAVAETLLEMAR